MRPLHLVIGHVAAAACFGTAVWIGFGLQDTTTGAPPGLDTVSAAELAEAVIILHGARQALVWQYLLMTLFTTLGVLLSGITLIAWWLEADPTLRRSKKVPGGALRPSSPRASGMWICGKRYQLR